MCQWWFEILGKTKYPVWILILGSWFGNYGYMLYSTWASHQAEMNLSVLSFSYGWIFLLVCRRFRDKKEAVEPEADPDRDQRTVFAYQVADILPFIWLRLNFDGSLIVLDLFKLLLMIFILPCDDCRCLWRPRREMYMNFSQKLGRSVDFTFSSILKKYSWFSYMLHCLLECGQCFYC